MLFSRFVICYNKSLTCYNRFVFCYKKSITSYTRTKFDFVTNVLSITKKEEAGPSVCIRLCIYQIRMINQKNYIIVEVIQC